MAEQDIEEVEYSNGRYTYKMITCFSLSNIALVTSDEKSYRWPCQCSGSYTLSRSEMEEGCNVVCCSNCSLSVHITNHTRLKINMLATSK